MFFTYSRYSKLKIKSSARDISFLKTILFFLIMIVMSLTMILSDMSEKQRDLVQKISLYEFRLRELEKKGKE